MALDAASRAVAAAGSGTRRPVCSGRDGARPLARAPASASSGWSAASQPSPSGLRRRRGPQLAPAPLTYSYSPARAGDEDADGRLRRSTARKTSSEEVSASRPERARAARAWESWPVRTSDPRSPVEASGDEGVVDVTDGQRQGRDRRPEGGRADGEDVDRDRGRDRRLAGGQLDGAGSTAAALPRASATGRRSLSDTPHFPRCRQLRAELKSSRPRAPARSASY